MGTMWNRFALFMIDGKLVPVEIFEISLRQNIQPITTMGGYGSSVVQSWPSSEYEVKGVLYESHEEFHQTVTINQMVGSASTTKEFEPMLAKYRIEQKIKKALGL